MNHKKKNAIILVAVSIAFVAIVIWIAWGNSALMVNEIKITNDKIPQSFEGFRIAQVSDLHNAELGKDNNKLIEKLNECEPDIIVLTGDLIDSNHTNLEVALSFARQAIKIAPCYFVTGNHEAWVGSQYEELKTSLENAGVTVLQDEAIELNYGDECIQLIGLNDPDFSERDSFLSESILETKLSEINISNGFTILLSHRPELFNVYQNKNIDLVLSGHAHGGQFRLPFLGGVIAPNQGLFPKYDAGTYTENGTTMIVSRGIGNSIIPVRINNRPEIIIIELNCG